MTKELSIIPKADLTSLTVSNPELAPMLVKIQENLPEIRRATQNFGKRQSQFMDCILTVSHPTPIRNMRQILSETEKATNALQEAYFNRKKKQVELRIKQRDMELETDELKAELMSIEIDETLTSLATGEKYISGAVRKIANYNEQYQSIQAKVFAEQNITEFSEIDFEAEEERYHIMTVFNQGINAARAKGGYIDEGNQIYLSQLGINGAVAQNEVSRLLVEERQMFGEGIEPPANMVLIFLNQMADKFKGCSTKIAEHNGMTTFTEGSTVQPKLIGGSK